MYAVIKTGGKQYKVSKDDIISVEKLSEDTGKKIKLNEVLIISDKGKPIVGDPLIKGASVEAEIMDHSRAAKITVFKKKRRHNYRRKQGHKQNITNLKILSINSVNQPITIESSLLMATIVLTVFIGGIPLQEVWLLLP